MNVRHHRLAGAALGTQREVVSFHFGRSSEPDAARPGPKVYIQAALHADEPPGLLVAHHLRQRLAALEGGGQLRAEIVLVPVANPIGLGQTVWRKNHGRFDLLSGENFNRLYPALFSALLPHLDGRLTQDDTANVRLIRTAMRDLLQALPAETELASLRKTLLGLACTADVVLDLHCDCEAVPHLYTGTPLWPQVEPLARCIGAQTSLLALESGDNPFDEACSQTWWQLAAHYGQRYPVPLACCAVTVELRGETDVSHAQAAADADALIAFLTHRGFVDGPAVDLPPLLQPATPLSGCQIGVTPASGVVVYHRAPGEMVRVGDPIADVVDPLTGVVCALKAETDGLLFAREIQRYATAGRSLFKIAGASPIRGGKLSTA